MTAKKHQSFHQIKHHQIAKALHERSRKARRQQKKHTTPASMQAWNNQRRVHVASPVWADYAAKRMGLLD